MSFHLENNKGEIFTLSGGHWAVYLHLAQCFSWVPAGTSAPDNCSSGEQWLGNYDSSDGQRVTQDDALRLADHLNAAARHPKIELALSDVIAQVEALVENRGTKIPDAMRMRPSHFYSEFSPLLLFLYTGSFSIN